MICDTSSLDATIYMAIHGVGSWSPVRVASNLAEFLDVIRRWLSLVIAHGDELWANDGALAPSTVKSIEDDVLTGLGSSDRSNLLSFMV